MTSKVSSINPRLANAFDRLKTLPGTASAVPEVSATKEALPAATEKTAKDSAMNPSPKPKPVRPMEVLGKSQTKPATMMVVEVVKNDPEKKPAGRPTQKVGDLKRDYVKISPAIPRALKDRLDDAFPSLKRDSKNGVVTMEDVVSQALDTYLALRGK